MGRVSESATRPIYGLVTAICAKLWIPIASSALIIIYMRPMKLFYAPQSPFARKVRAAAIELDLEHRLVLEYAEVVPGLRNAQYADRTNPLRKIPALVTGDGDVIFDSTVICEYLDALGGGNRLFPRDPKLRWRALTNHALAQGLCESVILLRYETWLRPEEKRWSVWETDHWNKIDSGLRWFDRNHETALCEPLNISHLALGSMLGYLDFRWPEHSWRKENPRVAEWFAEMENRPSFARTRPQAPPASSN